MRLLSWYLTITHLGGLVLLMLHEIYLFKRSMHDIGKKCALQIVPTFLGSSPNWHVRL